MIVDLNQEDLELIIHALGVLQDHDGKDDGAEELEGRLRATREQAAPEAQKHMARLQKHVAKYFELSQPMEEDPKRLVGVRLHREACYQAEAFSVAEALLFSPLWKLIREWKPEQD